jgi:hypothetical protein
MTLHYKTADNVGSRHRRACPGGAMIFTSRRLAIDLRAVVQNHASTGTSPAVGCFTAGQRSSAESRPYRDEPGGGHRAATT